ncbi:MAG TPA: cyanophycinase [Bacteroidia bacterium]|nr:cyanophycinase [Bacteroidia bacterium]
MEIPKGKLIAIGGNEDKGTEPEPNYEQKNNLNFFELQILSRVLHEMRNNKQSNIEVITSASSIPEEVGEAYISAFEKLGEKNVNLMHIKNREDAKNPEFIRRIKDCDGIMFTGGNQLRLSSIFGGTEIISIMQHRYLNEHFVIAGTSAGAMAMSNTMIYQGSSSGALLKGEVKITTGLGFIKNVIIDTHFNKRGRFGRLATAVASNPGCIGIGLGEDTGVIISENQFLEVIGSTHVTIVDGYDIQHSNIAELQEGSPISIENLKVHILTKGNGYDLTTRAFSKEVNAEKVK